MTGQAVPNPAGCPPPAQRCAACPYGTLLDGGDAQYGAQVQIPGMGIGGGFQAQMPMPQVQMPQMQMPQPQPWQPSPWQAQVNYQTPQMSWQMPQPVPAPAPMPMPAPAPAPAPSYNGNVNPYAVGMAVAQQNTMHWAVKLAMGGGWGLILLIALYWSNEWWAGRWPTKTNANNAVANAPADPGTNAPATNTPTPTPTTNTSSSPVGFDKGDGNYMYRLDHEHRLIQLGRIPCDSNARTQLMAWKAEGYMEVAWGGESQAVGSGSAGPPVVVKEIPSELLDTLRQLANETDAMRRDLQLQYPNRFNDSEAVQINGSSNSIKSLADKALGMAQGVGSK